MRQLDSANAELGHSITENLGQAQYQNSGVRCVLVMQTHLPLATRGCCLLIAEGPMRISRGISSMCGGGTRLDRGPEGSDAWFWLSGTRPYAAPVGG
jgi:hypothetical protein